MSPFTPRRRLGGTFCYPSWSPLVHLLPFSHPCSGKADSMLPFSAPPWDQERGVPWIFSPLSLTLSSFSHSGCSIDGHCPDSGTGFCPPLFLPLIIDSARLPWAAEAPSPGRTRHGSAHAPMTVLCQALQPSLYLTHHHCGRQNTEKKDQWNRLLPSTWKTLKTRCWVMINNTETFLRNLFLSESQTEFERSMISQKT